MVLVEAVITFAKGLGSPIEAPSIKGGVIRTSNFLPKTATCLLKVSSYLSQGWLLLC